MCLKKEPNYHTILADMENKEIKIALDIIENSGKSLFLTGRAGTGKTTFLRNLRETSSKRMVVLAPTGIAAINAGGVTIHSFFQLPFSPFLPEGRMSTPVRPFRMNSSKISIIKSLDLLVIDEVSMVRADLLDAVDAELRRYRNPHLPFGGVQLLLIGDLQQLPPVVKDSEAELLRKYYPSPYFFDSQALQKVDYKIVELQKVYRQSDSEFLSLLNDIRSGMPSATTLASLNSRCLGRILEDSAEEGVVRLMTHNEQARRVNEQRLAELPGEAFEFNAEIKGIFPESSFPATACLTLKEGAQVMFVRNDSSPEKRYYNGMMATVEEIDEEHIVVITHDDGFEITVTPEEWENNRYDIDATSGAIKEVKEGSFSQYPLRLAWAITIHKSQGLTFNKAIIDASRSFAHGQAYVALSRCRTLEGLKLEVPLTLGSVITDRRVSDYMDGSEFRRMASTDMSLLRREYELECLDKIFSFTDLSQVLKDAYDVVSEAYGRSMPKLVEMWSSMVKVGCAELQKPFASFASQYRSLIAAESIVSLNARVRAAAGYYLPKVKQIESLVGSTSVEHDSKHLTKRLGKVIQFAIEEINRTIDVLECLAEDGFSVANYLKARNKSVIEGEIAKRGSAIGDKAVLRQRRSGMGIDVGSSTDFASDILYPELFAKLSHWRRRRSEAMGKPAFVVASTKLLIAITNILPLSKIELKQIPGMGKVKLQQFGQEILEIITEFVSSDKFEAAEPLPVANQGAAEEEGQREVKPKIKQKDGGE